MLKLRLRRVGRKHDPSFRIVVTEATSPPKGKYLEAVGFYNARLKQLTMNKDRIKYWLSVGIKPTDTVHNLLVKEGVIEGKKISVHSTKPKKKKEEEEPVKLEEKVKEEPKSEEAEVDEKKEEALVSVENKKDAEDSVSVKKPKDKEKPVSEKEEEKESSNDTEDGKKEKAIDKSEKKE